MPPRHWPPNARTQIKLLMAATWNRWADTRSTLPVFGLPFTVRDAWRKNGPGRAILDINLRGRKAFPVLADRRVHIVFATRSPTP
jgi:hypothetical protein